MFVSYSLSLVLPLFFIKVILGLTFKHLKFSRRSAAEEKELRKGKLNKAVNSYFEILLNIKYKFEYRAAIN